MTIEKKLLLNYGYIREDLGKLFDFIDRLELISASTGLAECLNIKNAFVIQMTKQWIKDVKKYFKHYEEKIPQLDIDVKSQNQFENAFIEFTEKLSDYCITDIDDYLKIVQNSIRENRNNTTVSYYLRMIEAAVNNKKGQIMEIQKIFNGQVPEQLSVSNTNKKDS